MRKKFSLALVLLLSVALFVGCASKSSSGDFTDGTYSGKGIGFNGEMTVDVVIEGGSITDVILKENGESEPVIDRAFEVIKERVIEEQSPIIDTVSGATFSTFGAKVAVGEALKEAGKDFGDITLNTIPEQAEKKELDAVNTQLVVVGAGPSGLAAAISAKENGVDDVILIEKLDIISGNGKFDMNFFDMINSKPLQEDNRVVEIEDFIEMKKEAVDSDERKQVWAEGAYNLDPWLRDMGIELNFSIGGTNHMAEKDEYAGDHIQRGLEAKAKELGVDIRIGTKGIDLIMTDGVNTGVKVETRAGTYDINADAVIVATGGFSHNKELLEKYAPGAERVATSNQMGATGDFIEIFDKHNIKQDHMDILSVFKMIIKNRRDLTGGGDGFMLVNKEGKRFVAENESGLDFAHTILDQTDGAAYYIYDDRLLESTYRLQKHNDLGYHFKANTLEELADKFEIDATALQETLTNYNKAVNGDIEDEFRDEMPEHQLSETGPYYAVQVESAIHMTKGGVVANEKTEVLNNDNEIVKGLYASGEVTDTSGAYSASVVFGRIAGEEAAKFITEK